MYFSYKAQNASGDIVKGISLASTREEAEIFLAQCQLTPLSVSQKKGTVKIPKKKISLLFRQFATLFRAGVPAGIIMDTVLEGEKHKGVIAVVQALKCDIQMGTSLSEAFGKYNYIFDRFTIAMIGVGEEQGNFADAFTRIADQLESSQKLASQITGAMIYPCIVIVVAIAVIILVAVKVLPAFSDMFTELGTEIPAATKILVAISDFCINYGVFALIGFVALVFAFIKYYKTHESIRIKINNIMLKIPVFGELIVASNTAKFCRVFAILLISGITVKDSMDISQGTIKNDQFRNNLDKSREKVETGYSVSESLKAAEQFPALAISMTNIGETSGQLGDLMEKTAEVYEQETQNKISTLLKLMEPAITIVLALVVVFIAMAIMMPMYSMYESL